MPRRGFALVELLVVVAIILIVAGAYFGLRGRGKGGGPETIPGTAMQKAESVACQSNLNQLRQMIQIDLSDSGQPPARLDQGQTAAISKCPVSGQPYSYNPPTGQVWCTTSGHEKY